MRQGMNGLSISCEPLNKNYSSRIMQRSNQNLPFFVPSRAVKTLTVLQGFPSDLFSLLLFGNFAENNLNGGFLLIACSASVSGSVLHLRGKQPCPFREMFCLYCALNIASI